MLKAMLVASEVLPIEGRPARIRRSEGCRPPELAVEILEPGGDAREPAVALVGRARHVDRVRHRLEEALEAALHHALLAQLVEPLLGLHDLRARLVVDLHLRGTGGDVAPKAR